MNTLTAHSNRIRERSHSNETLTNLMRSLARNHSPAEIRQYVDRRIGGLIRLAGAALVPADETATPLKLEFGLEQLSATSRAVVEQSLATILCDMNALHADSVPMQRSRTIPKITLVSAGADQVTGQPADKPAGNPVSTDLTTEVASALAHKLRNHLAAIISAGEQLEETISGDEVEDRVQLTRLISRTAHEQRIVIDRFLQAFGPIKTRNQRIDLHQFIRLNLEQLQHRCGYSINCGGGDGQLNGVTDPELLGRIIVELAANAAEVSPQSSPTVHWHAQDGRLVIRVSNSGAVGPDEMYGSFRQPFFTNKPGHTGLGLNIAFRSAEALGGTLRPILLQDRTTMAVSIPFQIEDSLDLHTERNS